MTLYQVIRIIRARWRIVLAGLLSCMLGAYVATVIFPPRWTAHSRVLLNLLKPDPITGEVINGSGTRTYAASQQELATDYSVAGQAVDDLGWLSDPEMVKMYRSRDSQDKRDFRHWAAQLIIDHTDAKVVEGSNILDISYTGPTASFARAVTEALRAAYLETSLSIRRADTNRNADWYARESLKAQAQLTEAEKAKADFERQNHVFMANDTEDLDHARLEAMARAPEAAAAASTAGTQLAEVNSQISQMERTLGPNHPDLIALRSKRAALLSAQGQSAAAMGGGGRANLGSQTEAILANSDKVAQLKQLQARVDVMRDLYAKTATKAASLRQEAAIADTGLSPLGSATTPASPSFPNIPLIAGGSIILGLSLGVLIALLTEMLNRRIRGLEDMADMEGTELLAIIMPA